MGALGLPPVSSHVCLIVNPPPAAARPGASRPRSSGRCASTGWRCAASTRATSTTPASWPARRAARGETVVALSGDGMVGALADVLRERPRRRARRAPRRSRQRPRARARHPRGSGRGAARRSPTASRARWTSAWSRRGARRPGRAFVGIASVGFDSDANRIANEAPAWLGGLVYAYGALRALVAWRPARFEIELDPPGERLTLQRLHGRRLPTRRPTAAGCARRRTRCSTTACSRSCVLESVSKLAFLTKILPRVFKRHARDEPQRAACFARASVSHQRRPAVHDVRRRRSDRRAARARARGRGAVTVLVPRRPRGLAFAAPRPLARHARRSPRRRSPSRASPDGS